ncbi:MAG: nitroreductase family protein [Planctomycetota bacterium]|jgi:nitroreductase
MTVTEAIRKRYSCRAYQDKAVEQEKLDSIFEAARLAPSAKNLQDWRFVVVTDKETRRELAKAAGSQMFLENAGAIIVACSNSNYVMRCGQPIGPIDVAIALEHIALQATQLGLATCWIGSFYPEKVRAILDIPADIAVVELMALGYPADEQREPKRKSIEKILCYEKWRF